MSVEAPPFESLGRPITGPRALTGDWRRFWHLTFNIAVMQWKVRFYGSALGYLMPPLWGPDSFNDGAGMARLITIANFVHFNMPHGTDYLDPRLSVDDAWDVGAFVLSHPRPQKSGLDKDFPDLLTKPVDTPYGPYADGFPQHQHRFGPFAPIRAKDRELQEAAAAAAAAANK